MVKRQMNAPSPVSGLRISPILYRIVIDNLSTSTNREIGADENVPFVVNQSDVISIQGWSAELRDARVASAIFACVDSETFVSGEVGLPRDDVALHFRAPRLSFAGYRIYVRASELDVGRHVAYVICISGDGSSYSISDQLLEFFVKPAI